MLDRVLAGVVGALVGGLLVAAVLIMTDGAAAELVSVKAQAAAESEKLGKDAAAARQKAEALSRRIGVLEAALRDRDAKLAAQRPEAADPRVPRLEREVATLKRQLAARDERIAALDQSDENSEFNDAVATAPRSRPTVVGESKGFSLANLSFDGEHVLGEITNRRSADLKFATFRLNVYDAEGRLVEAVPIVISEFEAGETKSFDMPTAGPPPGGSYQLQLDAAL